ncbi:MAG TPA: hypothetical protein VGW38_09550, partial [Chloroflexota bacterium]|nr:hypothetical protein [Chloroflexota bacterium]
TAAVHRVLLAGTVLQLALGAVATHVPRHLDFQINRPRREAIVRRVDAGDHLPQVTFGDLASCQRHAHGHAGADRLLAPCGTVLIARDGILSVFFMRDRAWFGDGEGFLYRADGTPPPSRLFGCTGTVGITSAQRLTERWFWVWFSGQDQQRRDADPELARCVIPLSPVAAQDSSTLCRLVTVVTDALGAHLGTLYGSHGSAVSCGLPSPFRWNNSVVGGRRDCSRAWHMGLPTRDSPRG